MGQVTLRVDKLDPGDERLSESTASSVGIAVLSSNPNVVVVVVAAYDALGVPQEWTVRRSEITAARSDWIPVVNLTTPATEVVHDQGDLDGLEAARDRDDDQEGDG